MTASPTIRVEVTTSSDGNYTVGELVDTSLPSRESSVVTVGTTNVYTGGSSVSVIGTDASGNEYLVATSNNTEFKNDITNYIDNGGDITRVVTTNVTDISNLFLTKYYSTKTLMHGMYLML